MKMRATLLHLVLVATAILGTAGCFVSFPDYDLAKPDAGGSGASGGAGGAGGTAGDGNDGGAAGQSNGGGGGDTADAGPTCTDGMANGDESDIDCGGGGTCPRCINGQACSLPSDCVIAACTTGICQDTLCINGTVDPGESDIDCGGDAPTNAPKCLINKSCKVGTDCTSGGCSADRRPSWSRCRSCCRSRSSPRRPSRAGND